MTKANSNSATNVEKAEESPETDDLGIGDRFKLSSGTILTVVGVAPASEAPESAGEGALYEIDKESMELGDSGKCTSLYRPFHLDRALDAGAVYVGEIDVEEPTEPFWCDGCERPVRGRDRYRTRLLDAKVCSHGCRSDVFSEQRRKRIAE